MTEIPTAAVIIIGNEILSGRTQDTNLTYLGKRMDELGIKLVDARIVPDIEEIIVDVVNECRNKYSYVFTTGGIGPTYDDITSKSVAKAFSVEIERNTEAVKCMERYYEPGSINTARLKMADVPAGATLIKNPVSGAPGFQIENVFVLPGVPIILQAMFDGITDRLIGGDPVLTLSVTTNLGEGQIADDLSDLQIAYPDISIGSYPYFRKGKLGVNLVARSTNLQRLEELAGNLKKMLVGLGGKVIDDSLS